MKKIFINSQTPSFDMLSSDAIMPFVMVHIILYLIYLVKILLCNISSIHGITLLTFMSYIFFYHKVITWSCFSTCFELSTSYLVAQGFIYLSFDSLIMHIFWHFQITKNTFNNIYNKVLSINRNVSFSL